MFQIKPYTDKPGAFGLSVHSFVSYERIGKQEEERYRKGGRKPYFIELGGTPRWINLYAVADADVYYNYEAWEKELVWKKLDKLFFCTKLHNWIIRIDWLDAIDFALKKGYNVLNYTIVWLTMLSLVQRWIYA